VRWPTGRRPESLAFAAMRVLRAGGRRILGESPAGLLPKRTSILRSRLENIAISTKTCWEDKMPDFPLLSLITINARTIRPVLPGRFLARRTG